MEVEPRQQGRLEEEEEVLQAPRRLEEGSETSLEEEGSVSQEEVVPLTEVGMEFPEEEWGWMKEATEEATSVPQQGEELE